MNFYMNDFDINPEEIKSMRIALVVYNADDEGDVHVYLGRVQQAIGEGILLTKSVDGRFR